MEHLITWFRLNEIWSIKILFMIYYVWWFSFRSLQILLQILEYAGRTEQYLYLFCSKPRVSKIIFIALFKSQKKKKITGLLLPRFAVLGYPLISWTLNSPSSYLLQFHFVARCSDAPPGASWGKHRLLKRYY